MKKIIIIIVVLIILLISFFYWQARKTDNTQYKTQDSLNNEERQAASITKSYSDISAHELAGMLLLKDFKLIDVHVPEQKHIPQTDAFIPFNEIEKIVAALPDKSEKIVLYCRSGGMGRQVADSLVELGYENVFQLDKGLNGWVSEGRETLPIGSLSE